MKLLVISDIHGSSYYANKILDIVNKENPDKIVLLGDLYYHGPRNPLPNDYAPMKVADILNSLKEKLLVVKGNCDAEVDEMISNFKFEDNILLDANGKKIFFTHGHKYNINKLPNEEFDIMFYGHFHICFIKQQDGKIFVNPGSISLPKENTLNSYATIDSDKIYMKDINGNILEELKL